MGISMTKTPEIEIDRLLVRLKEAARLARSQEALRVRASATIEEVMSKLGSKKDVSFSRLWRRLAGALQPKASPFRAGRRS